MKKTAYTVAIAAAFVSATVLLSACDPRDEGVQGTYGPAPDYPNETTAATTTAASTTEYDFGNKRDGDGYDKSEPDPDTTTAAKKKSSKKKKKTSAGSEKTVTETEPKTSPDELSEENFEEDDGETFGDDVEEIADDELEE